jgi:transketolase
MNEPHYWTSPTGKPLPYWGEQHFQDAWASRHDLKEIADGCRLNVLSSIHQAGSGHIGTSFSSMDIFVAVRRFLQGEEFLTGVSLRHIFFSSKGHDAPALYASLHAGGELSDEQLFSLRRLGGLPGHPETITPGVATNTGSLGMGISKAKGFVKAQRLTNPSARESVVVLLGDGELNEGQIWESMPGAVKEGFGEIIAIVDSNGIQSDTWTNATLPMGDVVARAEAVGWHAMECSGNNPNEVVAALEEAQRDPRPSLIVARTIKGSGISWMESFPEDAQYYQFHSGALQEPLHDLAVATLLPRFGGHGIDTLDENAEAVLALDHYSPKPRPESMVTVWQDMLVTVMEKNESVITLDGDLSYDTGTHLARGRFPERYVQSGIAEQDMVSMAGTLALSGFIPFVHSFATFLTMRATEQIFNNASEESQIIYLGFLAGLIPSAAGFSHQAVTDVGIMGSIPGMRVFEPSGLAEFEWCVEQALGHKGPSYIRVGAVAAVESGSATVGHLNTLAEGKGVALVSSGPLLTQQALECRNQLEQQGFETPAVFSLPEITRPLDETALDQLARFNHVLVLENHNPARAKHFHIEIQLFARTVSIHRLGLEGLPANGQPAEVLSRHLLDPQSIAAKVVGLAGSSFVAADNALTNGDTYLDRESH